MPRESDDLSHDCSSYRHGFQMKWAPFLNQSHRGQEMVPRAHSSVHYSNSTLWCNERISRTFVNSCSALSSIMQEHVLSSSWIICCSFRKKQLQYITYSCALALRSRNLLFLKLRDIWNITACTTFRIPGTTLNLYFLNKMLVVCWLRNAGDSETAVSSPVHTWLDHNRLQPSRPTHPPALSFFQRTFILQANPCTTSQSRRTTPANVKILHNTFTEEALITFICEFIRWTRR